MGTLKEAIERFLEKQAQVYRADPNRIVRDARGARRAAQDYRGRWLLELLQNCEDAQTPLVRLMVKPCAINAVQGQSLTSPP